MRHTIALLALLFTYYCALSQELDTTIFETQFEQNSFQQYLDGESIAPIDLLLSFNYTQRKTDLARKGVSAIIEKLEAKDIRQKSLKKQLKLIYKYVHSSTLKKYESPEYFNELFVSGTYNCVSASALYALVLDHFDINYIIKETPKHVYLVADPENLRILIETTMPQGGMLYYDEKSKRDFVSYMVRNKLISQREYESNSNDALFNKYFYEKDNDIDIYQLAALQYYNKGITLFDEKKFKSAAANFEKASLLYNSTSIQYMHSGSYGNLLDEQNTSKKFDGKVLAKYINLNLNDAEVIQYGVSELGYVINELLVNYPDIVRFKQYYHDLITNLSDSVETDEFAQLYYYQLGYYNYANQNFAGAFQNLAIAHLKNPHNINIKNLIHDTGLKHMFVDRQHESLIDSFEYYFDIFPFLYDYNDYQTYYTYCYLKSIYDHYDNNKIKEGAALLKRFEQVIKEKPDVLFQDDHVERTFAMICYYYLEHDYVTKAKKYADLSVYLLPSSHRLRELQQGISNYKRTEYVIAQNKPKPKPTSQDYEKQFRKKFKASWISNKIFDGEELRDIQPSEKLAIKVIDDKKVEFVVNNEKQTGTWDMRPKAKLLYLIPKKDEKNYLVFKIVEISDTKLVIRPYENKKIKNEIIHFKKASN